MTATWRSHAYDTMLILPLTRNRSLASGDSKGKICVIEMVKLEVRTIYSGLNK